MILIEFLWESKSAGGHDGLEGSNLSSHALSGGVVTILQRPLHIFHSSLMTGNSTRKKLCVSSWQGKWKI